MSSPSALDEARSFFEGATERPLDTVEALAWDLQEQLQSAETTLAHAEAFIEHQDMSYRWAEWCEGRDPA